MKDLLANDLEYFADRLSKLDETVEQRVEKMRARVEELRNKKEVERRQVVEQKMLQKWRNDCDELRSVESKVFEKEVAEGRASQIIEKKMEAIQLEEGKPERFCLILYPLIPPMFEHGLFLR